MRVCVTVIRYTHRCLPPVVDFRGPGAPSAPPLLADSGDWARIEQTWPTRKNVVRRARAVAGDDHRRPGASINLTSNDTAKYLKIRAS